MKLFFDRPQHGLIQRRRAPRLQVERLEDREMLTMLGSFQDGLWRMDANKNGVWDGASGGDAEVMFGRPGDRPITGDWNGNGSEKMAAYDSKTGVWLLDANGNGRWDGAEGGDTQLAFVARGVPVTGDWNGDDTDQIGMYDPSKAMWFLDENSNGRWDGTSGGDAQFRFGRGGLPVSGDWDGNGIDEIGLYYPSNGLWMLDANGNHRWDGDAGDIQHNFRHHGGQPVVGDWDGNGTDDLGVFQSGRFLIVTDAKDRIDERSAAVANLNYFGGRRGLAPIVIGDPAKGLELFLSPVHSGNWSDPSTWGGTIPSAAHVVTIADGNTVTYDLPYNNDQSAEARSLVIRDGGTLRFSRTQSTRLDLGGSLVVLDGGTLDVGTPLDPISNVRAWIGFNVPNDRLFSSNNSGDPHFRPGPDPMMPEFHPEDTGLWVMGMDSKAFFNGAPKSFTWTKLAEDAPAGAREVALSEQPSGWSVGDTVVVTPSGSDPNEVELRSIAAINGNRIILDRPLAFLHKGRLFAYNQGVGSVRQIANESELGPGETLVRQQAEVGLLSQNVTVASNLVRDGDSNHRAHTMYMIGAEVSIAYTEFRDLGPQTKLGRYPIHFHKPGSTSAGNTVEGASIWSSVSEPGNRFIAIHQAEGITVEDVVAYNAQGAGLYLEDAKETGNTLTGNLVVRVVGPELLPNRTVAQRFGYPEGLATGIWARMGNTFRDNVVVGGVGASGIAITPLNLQGTPMDPTIFQGNEVRANRAGVEFFGIELSVNVQNGLIAENPNGLTFSLANALGISNSIFLNNLDQPASDDEYAAREQEVFFVDNQYVILS